MTSPTMNSTHSTTTPNPVTEERKLPDIPEKMIFSPNGQHLAVSFFSDRRVVHFGRANPNTFELEHPVDSMGIADNGTLITSCMEPKCTIWRGVKIQTIFGKSWVTAVAISRNGEVVVVGQENGSCALYKENHSTYIKCMGFTQECGITTATLTHSAAWLALGTDGGGIHLINVEKKKAEFFLRMGKQVISIDVSNDGSRLFARDIGNSTSFWRNTNEEPIRELEVALTEGPEYAQITPNGFKIHGESPRRFVHPGAKQVCISGDGSTSVTICDDFAMIWNGTSQWTYPSPPDSSFTLAAISGDGRRIALANDTLRAVTIIERNS